MNILIDSLGVIKAFFSVFVFVFAGFISMIEGFPTSYARPYLFRPGSSDTDNWLPAHTFPHSS